MRVIALATLKNFWRKPAHSDARSALEAWYHEAAAADWSGPAAIKAKYRHASVLKDGRVVFNIAGNKYRLVAWINYPYRVVYVRFVGTHRQYDAIDPQTI